MRREHSNTRENLARNLARLMQLKGWSQTELARESGVPQRTISDVLNWQDRKRGPSVELAEQLARPFALNGWDLIRPELPMDLETSRRFKTMADSFFRLNAEGQATVSRVAEMEARYGEEPDDDGNDTPDAA